MSQIDDALDALDALIDTLPTEGPQAEEGIRLANHARRGIATAITSRQGGMFVGLYSMTFAGIVKGSTELNIFSPEQEKAENAVIEHCNQLEECARVDLEALNAEFREFQDRHGIVPSYPPEDD